METYSLDFLRSDWPHAGAKFCYAALFDERLMTSDSVREFLSTLIANYPLRQIRVVTARQPDKHEVVPTNQFDALFSKQFSWEKIHWLDLEIESKDKTKYSGTIEFPSPDCLEIFAAAERFYTGVVANDLRWAADLATIAKLAIDRFGDAHGGFGIDHAPAGRALRMRTKQNPPNLTRPLDTAAVTAEIERRCQAYREETSSSFL